jgi:predicted ester cyclase
MNNSARNREIVSRIATEIWNQGKLAVCEEVMTEDAKYYGPHMPAGKGSRNDWKNAIGMYRSAFPDSHVRYEEINSFGETVVGRWTATGTHTGKLPGIDMPTGKKINITGITIYRFSSGKIVEAWEQLDLLGMWRQLGVIKMP